MVLVTQSSATKMSCLSLHKFATLPPTIANVCSIVLKKKNRVNFCKEWCKG